MRVSTLYLSAAALLAPLAVSASPLPRATDTNTITVLKFASVLEGLEKQFYKEASNFKNTDFTNAGFNSGDAAVSTITIIENDESTHVITIDETLTNLGGTSLTCTFNTTSLVTSVETFVRNSRIIEYVGVGAYLGAAHLVDDPRILTAVASIMTVESRHQSILNTFQAAAPIPQAFDTAFTFNEVASYVGSFVSNCDLGITANPPLTVTNTGAINVGTALQFTLPPNAGNPSGFSCQILIGNNPATATVLPIDKCVVPTGANGPTAIYITSTAQPLSGNVVDRQTQTVVAGPAIVLVDSTDSFGSLVRKTTS